MGKFSRAIQFDSHEWFGAFGDIGVLIPIFLSLAVVNGVDLARALLITGTAYITAGLYFRLPLPIQPLKAMAAIALAQGLGLDVIRAASLWMGALFLLLAWSGAIEKVSRLFPRVIVKGLQLGVGLLLIHAAWKLFFPVRLVAIPSIAAIPVLTVNTFWKALFVLVLPQIPLTLGNAVFGARDALEVYYGSRAQRASPRRLCVSLGLINLTAGVFHGYPLCHGSGGVTAHARLGARTAGATIIMGTVCLALAFFFGAQPYEILAKIPRQILGFLLLYVGVCHGRLFLQLKPMRERRVAVAMGLVTFVTGHLGWALGAGLSLHVLEGLMLRRGVLRPLPLHKVTA